MTDSHIEHSQDQIRKRADSYHRNGKILYAFGAIIIIFGSGIALYQMLFSYIDASYSWTRTLLIFVRSFTAYGLLVLAAICLFRFSRAMLDQSERLYVRRDIMSDRRLLLMLNDKMAKDEINKAFDCYEKEHNAFAFNLESHAFEQHEGNNQKDN